MAITHKLIISTFCVLLFKYITARVNSLFSVNTGHNGQMGHISPRLRSDFLGLSAINTHKSDSNTKLSVHTKLFKSYHALCITLSIFRYFYCGYVFNDSHFTVKMSFFRSIVTYFLAVLIFC